jgi:hypothetical protein
MRNHVIIAQRFALELRRQLAQGGGYFGADQALRASGVMPKHQT